MFINDEDKKIISELFEKKVVNPAKLVVFTKKKSNILLINDSNSCQYCEETVALIKELAELSDNITVEVHDFEKDNEKAGEYNIDRIPAIAVVGERDYGIRYFGIPSGYEFSSLLEDIVDVSQGTTDLASETKEKLKSINTETHIRVFVTPTCPYCAPAVRLAHKMAIENENIRADMVEAQEFPRMAQQYNVRGVPRVVINENISFEGALPEPQYLEYVLQASNQITEEEVTTQS